MEINYNLSYSCRDENNRHSIMDLSMSFENPSDEVLRERINTWLSAIGKNLEVVYYKT